MTLLKLKWCREYALRPDAKAAALAAGYSKSSAYQRGHENSRCPECMAEIARLRSLDDEAFLVRRSDVIRELVNIAMADLGDILEWGNEVVEDDDGHPVTLPNGGPLVRPAVRLVNSCAIPPALRRTISEVSGANGAILRVRMHDRIKALELLARIDQRSATLA